MLGRWLEDRHYREPLLSRADTVMKYSMWSDIRVVLCNTTVEIRSTIRKKIVIFSTIWSGDLTLLGLEPRSQGVSGPVRIIYLIYWYLAVASDSRNKNVQIIPKWLTWIFRDILTLSGCKSEKNLSGTTMLRWVDNSAWWSRIHRALLQTTLWDTRDHYPEGCLNPLPNSSRIFLSKDVQILSFDKKYFIEEI